MQAERGDVQLERLNVKALERLGDLPVEQLPAGRQELRVGLFSDPVVTELQPRVRRCRSSSSTAAAASTSPRAAARSSSAKSTSRPMTAAVAMRRWRVDNFGDSLLAALR